MTYITDIDPTSPAFNAPAGNGDDEIRELKGDVKNSFPNISGAVTKTHTQINNLAEIDDLIPVGSAAFFAQAAAPTGWTKSTGFADGALRIVTGASGGTTGGSVSFSGVFREERPTTTEGDHSHTITVNDHTLTAAESGLPSHSHNIEADFGSAVVGGTFGVSSTQNRDPDFSTQPAGGTDASEGHNHGASSNTTGDHSHTVNTDVQYMDAILCIKDAY